MGVSILMTPGPVGRNFGKQISITPGWRSQAASILRLYFGEAPFTLTEQQDSELLNTLYNGASVYTPDEDNMWYILRQQVREHGSLTITLEY